MPKIFQTLDKIKPIYDVAEKVLMFLCKLLLVADIVIVSYNVLGRYCTEVASKYPDTVLRYLGVFTDPAWTEEVILTLMSYMAVLAAALAIRHNTHIRMTALDRYLPKTLVRVLDVVADVAVMALAVIMLVVGFQFCTTLGGRGFYTSLPWLSRFWMYLPVPVAGLFMIVFEIEALYNHVKAFYVSDEGKEAEA